MVGRKFLEKEAQGVGFPGSPSGQFPGMLLVQVEDAVLDTYDLVYDQAMKSPSSSWWQELATIQDMVSEGQGGHTCCAPREWVPDIL